MKFLLCLSAASLLFSAAAAPAPEPCENIPDDPPWKLENIISGRDPMPDVDGDALQAAVADEAARAGKWLRAESRSLRRFLAGSAAAVAVGLLAALALKKSVRRARRGPGRLKKQLMLKLAVPVIVLLVTVTVFGFMLPLLRALPGLYPWDAKLFFTVLTLIIAWFGFGLAGIMDARLRKFARRSDNLDALMVDIAGKVIKTTLAAITVLFIGQSIFELNITTLLAGAGVLGLAVAFASRETIATFFGTIVIILDHPFRCGDRVRIGDIDGIVESVGMRSTRILTGSESIFTIPNSTIAAANIENISRRGVIRYAFTLGLTYDTPSEKLAEALRILHETVDNFHGPDRPGYSPRIFLEGFGASSVNVRVIIWLKTGNFKTEEEWRTAINLDIIRRFAAARIAIAYNTVTAIIDGAVRISPPGADHAPGPEPARGAVSEPASDPGVSDAGRG